MEKLSGISCHPEKDRFPGMGFWILFGASGLFLAFLNGA